MSQDIQQIINGELDLYLFLEVNPVDSVSVIRRQYRKKALLYHPDKLGDAAKFTLLNVVYNILSDETLRGEYDKIRKAKLQKSLQRSQLEELTKKFQDDLRHSESKLRTDKRNINIEQIREDGIKRRRIHEQQFISSKNPHYVSFQDLPSPDYISITLSTSNPRVEVKWKYKRELSDYFDGTVLHQIMQIFGPIASVTVNPHKSGARYDSGTIQYEHASDLQKACSHDFRKSASLWDGTPVRKVASLVRECKEVSNINTVVEDILARYDETRKSHLQI